MPLLSLPNECFNDVFSFLDNKSLYKCLFVNRYYCKLSIPIIWRDPFITLIPNGFSLIKTLLSCLNEDEISSLIPCAINLNNQTPLFEYGKFIRNIYHEHFVVHVMGWLKSSSPEDCRVQRLVNVIYHAIMRQGSNLQELVLSSHHIVYTIGLPKFSIFTNYKPGIKNLRSLSMDICDDVKCQNIVEFLNMVPKFCSGIVYCVCRLNDASIKPFLNIIKSQPLEKISIYTDDTDDIGNFSHIEIGDFKKIIYTLEFRSETLRELSFEDLDFQGIDLSFVFKLECLERLRFDCCKGFFMSKHYKALSKKKLHLKEFNLWHDICNFYDDNGWFNSFGVTLNVVETMISSFCSEALLKLSLNIVTLETVKAINEFCPNIIFLYIEIYSDQFLDLIIPLICKRSLLKILKIGVYDNVDTELFFKILCDHLISVESLLFNFHIELPSFEYFASNCKANLKKLTIIFDEIDKPLRKHYLTCVNNYQRMHNSLKVFETKCDQYYKSDGFDWTNEELEIIDLLEDQGVDVVSTVY